MRIQVNLASKPFVELGSVYKRLRIVMAALAVVAVVLGVLLRVEAGKAATAQGELSTMKNQTTNLQRERSRDEARMKQPKNAETLERSRFLNSLFTQKSFSWTAVMMDLENVLPAGVQVSSIEPQAGSDGNIRIRLRVLGDRDKAVDLVRNLEHAKRFIEPRVASESLQASGNQGPMQMAALGGNVEFDILSGYNPPAPKVDTPKEEKQAEPATLKPVAPKPVTKVVAPVKPVTIPVKGGLRK